MNAIDVSAIPPLTRRTDARQVALDAYDQLLELLDGLDADDWAAPTECAGWTVADMVGHVIGAAREGASIWQLARQQTWGNLHRKRFDGNPLDAVNALQVRDHAGLSPEQRISALRKVAPKAVAGRMRIPAMMRAASVAQPLTGSVAEGSPARIHFGHLFDVIFTRDVWLHTIDIARATKGKLDLSRDVNRRVIADVVAEWSRRHGQPFTLILAGPAGGEYTKGVGGERLDLDAVEFCRVLSGRAKATGLLTNRVYF